MSNELDHPSSVEGGNGTVHPHETPPAEAGGKETSLDPIAEPSAEHVGTGEGAVENAPPQASAETAPPQAAPESAPQIEPAQKAPAPAPEELWQPGDFKLVLEQGLSIGKEFLLSEPEMLVGRRDPEQDFIPDIDLFDQETANNRYISRRQVRIYFHEGRLWLEDLDSSNGTAINSKLVAPHEPRILNLNDKLLFGQSVLVRLKRV